MLLTSVHLPEVAFKDHLFALQDDYGVGIGRLEPFAEVHNAPVLVQREGR